MKKVSLALCALAVAVAPARAGTNPTTEGTLATREGKEIVQVPLEHTDVKVRIDGFVADVEVDQRFHNPFAHKIEAVYLFPLPAQSAVDGYELVIGGRTIRGQLKLKADAKTIYKEARTKGYVAALLAQERPNLFTQTVANIEPDATIDVKLHYVQALAYDSGAYELVFPMVAPPRYVPKSSKVDAAAVQPAVLPPGTRSGHDIAVTVDLDAGVPIRGVRSPSHAIDIARASPRAAHVTIGARDTIPNKDFVLRYDVAADKRPEFAVVPGSGAFFFMAQPPVAADASEVTPKELVFVIDTSSSMQGKPLAKAKQAIARALRGMHADDTFQIVRFDDTASALGARPIANKPKNVDRALAWLDRLEAGGGTEMASGVLAALTFPHDRARLRVVVFLTDGFIGNEDEILALVQQHVGDARLFSFGVGSAVNRYLLEEMATIGRGAVQVVRPDEDTDAAVAKLEKRIASPLLTDLAIDWKGLAVEGVSPAKIPDLFAGQPLVLAGRYTAPGAATVTITGKLAGRAVSFDVPVVLPATSDRPAIAAIWARGRIAELSRAQLRGEKPEVKQQIVDLALAHHLMSQYTSFVAVDSSRVTKGGAAETVAVPVEVPDGLQAPSSGIGGMSGGVIGSGSGAAYGDVAYDAPSGRISRADLRYEAAKSAPPAPSPLPPAPRRDRSDTAVSAMRAEVDRCYTTKGTARVSIDLDGSGASVAVSGGDAAFGECVRSAAKRWRSAAKRHLDLAVTK